MNTGQLIRRRKQPKHRAIKRRHAINVDGTGPLNKVNVALLELVGDSCKYYNPSMTSSKKLARIKVNSQTAIGIKFRSQVPLYV